jgi:hypothetical protein
MVGAFFTLKQTINALVGIYGKIEDGSIKDHVKNRDVALYQARGSIVRLLSTFIIEPTIVISKNLREEEITEKLSEINVDIFTSFYLQAFNVLTNVYKFDVNVAFDVLSSKGSLMTDPRASLKFSIEDFDETLNILPIKKRSLDYLVSTEAKFSKKDLNVIIDATAKKTAEQINKSKPVENKSGSGLPRVTAKDSKSVSLPTMIQKEVELTQKITNANGVSTDLVIPILIKATVIYSDFSNIETMISTNDKDKRFGNRLDEYKSGMISMKDLIFADDLIKEYKNNKLKDKDNLIDFMEARATSANKKMLSSGAIGLNKYYGILIVSKNQMSIIEQKLGGSIDKPRYKEMLMEQTKSLIVNVVDSDWERVFINIKDLRGTSDISYKVINNKKNTTNSNDLADIFKAISTNKPPVF